MVPDSSGSSPVPKVSSVAEPEPTVPSVPQRDGAVIDSPSVLSASGISSGAQRINLPQQDSRAGSSSAMSAFSRFTSGFGLRLPPPKEGGELSAASAQGSVLESFTKGLVDSSRNAVKAVQVKARHIVSQNKRRYQEGGFDLDMTYITENIIAMGFPAGDISSGLFGYFEGLYRNHMEEVIQFFETHHKGKYKVYNLCSERLYDASLFEGKVACFPFDDHNCPPIQLILSFCQSAYSWLKEDILNVVVVHCKAGMARTGLMICSLLLYLKFFPTAEEAIDYYNQKRCVDGKALVLPSQIRYVKYFERTLINFNAVVPIGRRCMLRGFRLHRCPFWIRPSITISNHNGILFSTRKHPKTKDLMPEDFWIRSPRKGIMVFAIPGERGLTELAGDFKVHFHDRQGDFYCWFNTSMMENRVLLKTSDLDGFDKRKLPSPGFHVEVVMIDNYGSLPSSTANSSGNGPDGNSTSHLSTGGVPSSNCHGKASVNEDNDNVFSDSDEDDKQNFKGTQTRRGSGVESTGPSHVAISTTEHTGDITSATNKLSLGSDKTSQVNASKEAAADGICKSPADRDYTIEASDIKAMAADASVFTFGDEEEYESE